MKNILFETICNAPLSQGTFVLTTDSLYSSILLKDVTIGEKSIIGAGQLFPSLPPTERYGLEIRHSL